MSIVRIILIVSVLLVYSQGDETLCTINGKRAVQRVSEKFLSISIDPAVLLTGLNLSDASLRLAKHLSPAYIRIAGPSTQFVKYIDNEDKTKQKSTSTEETANVVVTPSMWFGINEWLTLANLTPVFAINDAETSKGVWNPKSTLPLLELSDKLNVTCFWQLGFDCSNKSVEQYKQDINIFHHIRDAFPERIDTWKIIGSDISRCLSSSHIDSARSIMEDMKDTVEAIMWEPPNRDEMKFPERDVSAKLLSQPGKSDVVLWTSVPKTASPISFASALLWAKQIGNAATFGYAVVFRQPRLHEMFSSTPAYWFSLLHKMLMGSNVLDVRVSHHNPDTSVFAHCTRKQNSFVRRGAMTVLIVNNGTEICKALLRMGAPHLKTTEVQSYILTSTDENATEIFLNDEKLTVDILDEDKLFFTPKLRRAKTTKPVLLAVPPKSIGFFVLSDARIPVCVNEEQDMNLLLEEIDEDQQLPLSEELVMEIGQRGSFRKKSTLKELQDEMEKELESDEKFYKRQVPIVTKKYAYKKEEEKPRRKVDLKGRSFFIERARLAEKKNKHANVERKSAFKTHLKERFSDDVKRSIDKEEQPVIKKANLELSSSEVQTVLKNRAKSKAAKKNIIFTSEELDELIGKASRKYSKAKFKRSADKRDINMKLLNLKSKYHNRKNEMLRSPLKTKESFKEKLERLRENRRYKRDINMDMLKIKTEVPQAKKFQKTSELNSKKSSKNKFRDGEEKEATMRDPNKTSDELLEELESEEESEETNPPNREIYAELAESDETEEFTEKTNKYNLFDRKRKSKTNPTRNSNSRWSTKDENPHKKSKSRTGDEDRIQFLTESDEFDDLEEGFPCIHEYFSTDLKPAAKKSASKLEIWEMEQKLNKKTSRKKWSESTSSSSEEDSESDQDKEDAQISDEKDYRNHGLFKRDINHITQEDIINYRKIMENNLKDLQYLAFEEKLKSDEDKLNKQLQTLTNEDSAEKLKGVLGQPQEFLKAKNDKKAFYKQIEVLQKRLAHKKKISELLKKHAKHVKDSEELGSDNGHDLVKKVEELLENRNNYYEVGESQALKPTTAATLTKEDKALPHVTASPKKENKALPHVNIIVKRSLVDHPFGRYKPFAKDSKQWRPSDIRNYKRNTQPLEMESICNHPISTNFFHQDNFIVKSKRSLNEVSSAENEIDSFLNDIVKDTKFIHPKIDTERGEFEVILPNKDKFDIKENHGDTNIEFLHHGVKKNKIIKSEDGNEKKNDILVVNDEKVRTDDVLKKGTDILRGKKTLNIQKIPSKEEETHVRTFFKSLTGFFRNIGENIKSCVEYLF